MVCCWLRSSHVSLQAAGGKRECGVAEVKTSLALTLSRTLEITAQSYLLAAWTLDWVIRQTLLGEAKSADGAKSRPLTVYAIPFPINSSTSLSRPPCRLFSRLYFLPVNLIDGCRRSRWSAVVVLDSLFRAPIVGIRSAVIQITGVERGPGANRQ
jgi:hypothetical protein